MVRITFEGRKPVLVDSRGVEMIDKNKLLEQLKRLEQWNNSDVPNWVVNVINGMPETEQEYVKDLEEENENLSEYNRILIERKRELEKHSQGWDNNPRGKWLGIRLDSIGGGSYFAHKCSICDSIFRENYPYWNYCPHCGTQMREKHDGCN